MFKKNMVSILFNYTNKWGSSSIGRASSVQLESHRFNSGQMSEMAETPFRFSLFLYAIGVVVSI